MKENEPKDAFVEKVKIHLDASVETLEERTVSRLRQVRLDTLEAVEGRRFFRIPRWVTASGFATLAVVVVAGSFWFADHRRNLAASNLEDIEIVAANDHIQLYEDLEFYRWLAAEDRSR